jgi:hypothetical protein
MKKNLLLLAVSVLSLAACTAQKGPLKGSGKIVTKTFEYKEFNKIELQDLDGKAEIETGKPFSITTSIDDNLESLLSVSVNNEELKIELKGNTNNRMYIEETGIHIKITLPEISFLKHRGNGNVYVNEIAGKKLEVRNGGNGNLVLKGSIDALNISCSGNGNINAEQVLAKIVAVKRSGNGNVTINTDNPFTANSSGNGNVINKGMGLADATSSASGNSSIIDARHTSKKAPIPDRKMM